MANCYQRILAVLLLHLWRLSRGSPVRARGRGESLAGMHAKGLVAIGTPIGRSRARSVVDGHESDNQTAWRVPLFFPAPDCVVHAGRRFQ